MELKNLKQHVRSLITLPTTEAPVISCYQGVSNGYLADRNAYVERMRCLQQGLSGQARRDFDAALPPIEQFLADGLLPDAKGLAVFSRAGAVQEPFFLPLQFRVPLPNWIAIDATPNIYHLVELKDTYDRYVVMIATEQSVRIVQINLGTVTAQMWEKLPELRRRAGREWTKTHYQRHRKERGRKFLQEMISLLDTLMSAGQYSHLILAGHSSVTARVQNELPEQLKARLVDTIPASGTTPLADVVKATLTSFVEAEEQESRATVGDLLHQLRTGGLAVVGIEPSFRALCRNQVDVLVLASEFEPGHGWSCDNCEHIDVGTEPPKACPNCSTKGLRAFAIKEQMVRKAEQSDCRIEIVKGCDNFVHLGGVGCLLSYRLPDEYA